MYSTRRSSIWKPHLLLCFSQLFFWVWQEYRPREIQPIMAAPIRVGFIGLSGKGWGPSAHIPYLITSPKYKIVAVCNTSVASAAASISKTNSVPRQKLMVTLREGQSLHFEGLKEYKLEINRSSD